MSASRILSHQFILFLVAGGLAALVNFGSRILLSHWLDYVPSIVVAYLYGMTTAFILNRLFVFERTTTRLHRQITCFALVNVAAVLQTIAVSILFSRWILPALDIHEHVETIAHAIGVAVPVVTSYFGHKQFTFAQRSS